MRFSHFVFIAGVILLSSCNAVTTASGEGQAKLSMVAATDGLAPVRVLNSSNDKRFLRSHKEDDEDKDDEEEEERGIMTPEQVAKWTARANQWVKEGKKPAERKEYFGALSGNITPKDREKLMLFLAAYGKAHPEALGRN